MILFCAFMFNENERRQRKLLFQALDLDSADTKNKVLNSLPDSVIIADKSGISYMNREAMRLL